jgi:aminoglycoside phosphotransferase (APT) family kinase protein
MNSGEQSSLPTPAEARAMARKIIEHQFDKKPKEVHDQSGGLTNLVFEVEHPEGPFIVRIGTQPAKIEDFLKEQWAMEQAKQQGVPVPEVLEVGTETIPLPYMVSRKVVGIEATYHPKRDEIIGEMGRLTALIHKISTSGFGHTFDWSGNKLSRKETWAEYLRRELKLEERLEQMQRYKMLSAGQSKGLRSVLIKIESWDASPVLNHGDMRLKNVIVDPDKVKIAAVLDWEHCTSNIAPYWDLSLALHDLSIDEKQVFLQGYGLKPKQIVEIAPVLKALNIINYASVVAEAGKSGDKTRLEEYRVRFSGALDLYSL